MKGLLHYSTSRNVVEYLPFLGGIQMEVDVSLSNLMELESWPCPEQRQDPRPPRCLPTEILCDYLGHGDTQRGQVTRNPAKPSQAPPIAIIYSLLTTWKLIIIADNTREDAHPSSRCGLGLLSALPPLPPLSLHCCLPLPAVCCCCLLPAAAYCSLPPAAACHCQGPVGRAGEG